MLEYNDRHVNAPLGGTLAPIWQTYSRRRLQPIVMDLARDRVICRRGRRSAQCAACADCGQNTAVLLATEFGRTAAVNGTRGTDHGTGAAAFLIGGAVAGGRMLADWPGLAPAALHEGRDVRPTLDLRAVIKGVLHEQLGVADRALDSEVFPDSGAVRRIAGLIRA